MYVNDPFPAFEFLKLGQLGQMFGLTATAIGTKLKQIGLRLPNGDPTEQAKSTRLAKLAQVEGFPQFWVWEKVRTVKVLEAAGCRRSPTTTDDQCPSPSQPPAPVPMPRSGSERLLGPFVVRHQPETEGGDGFEIVDANGVVAAWTRGERLSRRLAEVMTLADRFGKL